MRRAAFCFRCISTFFAASTPATRARRRKDRIQNRSVVWGRGRQRALAGADNAQPGCGCGWWAGEPSLWTLENSTTTSTGLSPCARGSISRTSERKREGRGRQALGGNFVCPCTWCHASTTSVTTRSLTPRHATPPGAAGAHLEDLEGLRRGVHRHLGGEQNGAAIGYDECGARGAREREEAGAEHGVCVTRVCGRRPVDSSAALERAGSFRGRTCALKTKRIFGFQFDGFNVTPLQESCCAG